MFSAWHVPRHRTYHVGNEMHEIVSYAPSYKERYDWNLTRIFNTHLSLYR